MKTLLIIALSTFFFNGTPNKMEVSEPCKLSIKGIATLPNGSQVTMTLTGEGASCKEAREGMKETIIRFKIKKVRH